MAIAPDVDAMAIAPDGDAAATELPPRLGFASCKLLSSRVPPRLLQTKRRVIYRVNGVWHMGENGFVRGTHLLILLVASDAA